MQLEDKVAIITGAARGIGRASALEFAREGARVVIADVDEAGLSETASLAPDSSDMAYMVTDVSQARQVEDLVRFTVERHGRLDVMFTNAGILQPATVVDMPEETWDRIIDVNLKGVFLGCKYAIPALLQSGGGSIINTGSVNSLVAEPFLSAYCASKGRRVDADQTGGARLRAAKHSLQLHLSRLGGYAHQRPARQHDGWGGEGPGGYRRLAAYGPARDAAGDRAGGGFPRVGRFVLHDRQRRGRGRGNDREVGGETVPLIPGPSPAGQEKEVSP